MKIKSIALILTGFLVSGFASAAFVAETPVVKTEIQQVNDMYPTHKINSSVADKTIWKEDQIVFLKGKITKQVKHDKFIFTDGTGEVLLEIEDDVWDGADIKQNEEFIVKAKVDTHKKRHKNHLEAIEVFKNK